MRVLYISELILEWGSYTVHGKALHCSLSTFVA